MDRGIEPLCQDWESCILTIRWIHHLYNLKRAEAGGFEPPVRLPVRQFSKLLVSATHPNFLTVVRCNHRIIFAHLLIADAKVWIYFYSSKLFANFFSLFLHFSCFLFGQRLRKRPSPYYILDCNLQNMGRGEYWWRGEEVYRWRGGEVVRWWGGETSGGGEVKKWWGGETSGGKENLS